MIKQLISSGLAVLCLTQMTAAAADPQHVMVYQKAGKYPAWPANNGIWIWGDEIVVGFTLGDYLSYNQQKKASLHAVNPDKPRRRVQSRSLDGGLTWKLEEPASLRPGPGSSAETPLKTPLDFTQPDSALMFRYGTSGSCFFWSADRCRTWSGPYAFAVPEAGRVSARTDVQIEGPGQCLMFASAASPNSDEGRPFCARTLDGGLTWKLASFIGPDPEGMAIMPATVKLGNGELFTTVRRRVADKPAWIEAWRSADQGKSWKEAGVPAPGIGTGNPPSLLKLPDGRLCLIYGYRAKPYGIHARLSSDEGRTWGGEIVLRKDALNSDLGYPRSVVRADGTVVTVYYYNGPRDEDRTLQATLWKP